MKKELGKVSVVAKKDMVFECKIKDAEIAMKKMQEDHDSVLYIENFSYLRDNIVDWIPSENQNSVLEIGAQYGAITTYLLERFADVTVIEESEEKAFINIYRNIEKSNLSVYIADTETALSKMIDKKFDNILIMNLDATFVRQSDILKKAYLCLKDGGKLIYSVPNKYGIKCWAQGGKISKNAAPKSQIMKTLKNMGFKRIEFYYPYPSVKFATDIYSDEYLPKVGELTHSVIEYNQGKCAVFDELEKMDEIIRDGLFSEYVNEYLIVAEKES